MVVMFLFRSWGCEVLKRLPSDAEAREEVFHRLLRPTDDCGPALPEIFRKYSETHGIDLRQNTGDDDAFGGGCEMTGFRTESKVKFSDEVQPSAPVGDEAAAEPEVKVYLPEESDELLTEKKD